MNFTTHSHPHYTRKKHLRERTCIFLLTSELILRIYNVHADGITVRHIPR